MPDYNGFFLKANSAVIQYEMLEISHPSFSQVYRCVRNAAAGKTVTLEDATVETFAYYPFQLNQGEESDDLDQTLQVTFGDVGEVLPAELDRVVNADTFSEYPILLYRAYRSDDLTAPMEGPTKYNIVSLTPGKTATTIVAAAASLNNSQTGEIYSFDRFPMLKGFS